MKGPLDRFLHSSPPANSSEEKPVEPSKTAIDASNSGSTIKTNSGTAGQTLNEFNPSSFTKPQLRQTLLRTGREVFCIINEILIPSKRPGESKAWFEGPPTNYDTLPTCPTVTRKEGTSIRVVDKRFCPYMDEVEKWSYELSGKRLNPIAVNKSQKSVAATMPLYKGRIHFLPPSTKCTLQEAISLLLDIILQPSRPRHPSWRMQLVIPGLKHVHDKMKSLEKQIQDLGEQLEGLRREQACLDRFRDLVSPDGTGDYLESIVKDVLLDLGIKTKRTSRGFPVDLVSEEYAFEITGVSKGINVSSEKYNQTLRFLEGHRKNEKIVLIANTFKNKRPSERPTQHFGKEVAEHLGLRGVCLMTTMKLYCLWRDVAEGKMEKETVIMLLKETKGELQ